MHDVAIELPVMRETAAVVAGHLKMIANPDRLLLLCQLAEGEQSVGELEDRLDIRQPTLSQQLAVLRAEGAVNTRREGKHVFYCIADDKLLQLLRALYDLYCKTGP
jgi:DNA-binding transcriptional ArsR family regulator